MKKFKTMTAMLMLLVVFTAGCAKTGNENSVNVTTGENETTKTEATMSETTKSEATMNTDIYDSTIMEYKGMEQNYYYSFYDLDGNGTMELIIAGGEGDVSSSTFSPWNYKLYGYDGANVVQFFPDVEFGYRTTLSIYENGVIEIIYASSAAESGVDFYKIDADGFTPMLIDAFSMVGRLEGDEPVFTYLQNENEITEEEYNANVQSYEVALTGLEWVQIK